MRVIVNGKNIKVRPSTKEYVEEKLMKFDKYFKTEIDAKVMLGIHKDRHTVEITMPLKNGVIFRAEETSDDLFTSIDLVMDKLNRQMRKHKSKIEKKYHKHEAFRFSEIPDYEGDEEESRIVKTKTFSVKPMDPEEAVLQMEMLGHGFFVFRNGESNEVNVVYIRKDGDYGLIEPTL